MWSKLHYGPEVSRNASFCGRELFRRRPLKWSQLNGSSRALVPPVPEMASVGYVAGLLYRSRGIRFHSVRIVGSSSSSEVGVFSRKQVLDQVDKELQKGDERAALALVKDLQGKPGGFRCFGASRQVRDSVLSSPVGTFKIVSWKRFLVNVFFQSTLEARGNINILRCFRTYFDCLWVVFECELNDVDVF